MRIIDNYREWISPEWIKHCTDKHGLKQNGNKGSTEHTAFEGFTWELYDRHNTDFNIAPPFDFGTHNWEWWIKKLLPGDGFPVVNLTETTRRLWMPLTDYEMGHIFIYEEQMIAPFSSGDLFEFEHNSPYAAVNLGVKPYYMMMFSVSKDTQWDGGMINGPGPKI